MCLVVMVTIYVTVVVVVVVVVGNRLRFLLLWLS